MFEAYKSKITGSTYLFAPANGLVFVCRGKDNTDDTRMTKDDIDVYVPKMELWKEWGIQHEPYKTKS